MILNGQRYYVGHSYEQPKKWCVWSCRDCNYDTTHFVYKDGFKKKRDASNYILDVICKDVFPWRHYKK